MKLFLRNFGSLEIISAYDGFFVPVLVFFLGRNGSKLAVKH